MAIVTASSGKDVKVPTIISIWRQEPGTDPNDPWVEIDEFDGLFYDTEYELKLVGQDLIYSWPRFFFGKWKYEASVVPGTHTEMEVIVKVPKMSRTYSHVDGTEHFNFPEGKIKVFAYSEYYDIEQPDPIMIRALEDNVSSLVAGFLPNVPVELASEEETLIRVILDSNEEDLSLDPENRSYGIEQVKKYQKAIDGIENKTFTDHVADIYIYDPNDNTKSSEHPIISKETNFYIRKYEEAQINKDIRTMPFYYSNNVSVHTVDNESEDILLSSVVVNNRVDIEKRNKFYKSWNFSNKLNQSVFFKGLYEPNDVKAFPRYMKVSITLEPLAAEDRRLSNAIDDSVRSSMYDKFCMKYIKIYDQEQKRKYVIAGQNYLSIQEMGGLQIELLFQDEEAYALDDISVIGSQSNASSATTNNMNILGAENIAMQRLIITTRRNIGKRSYHDILSGVPAKTEPFLYEIRKYDASGSKVNSFYLPARLYYSPNKSNVMNFVDTQVSHGQRYSYELISHQIIYGESYNFIEDLDFDQMSQFSAEVDIGKVFDIEISYDTRIFPITIASWESYIEAPPGLAPSVKIIPQKNKNGMPKFFLQSSFGQNTFYSPEVLYPALSSEEISKNQRTIRDFSINGIKGPEMSFHSRFQNKHYEVYRLANKPTEIGDFSGALIARVSPLYSDDLSFGSSAIFEDNIVNNKKYYYLFRAVDVWGTPTLSTGPFEYEVVSDGKSSVVNFKPYDIHSDIVPQGEVNARNIVRLSPHPRELQIPIGEEELSLSSAFSYVDAVGQPLIDYLRDKMTRESKFWNKKYKIRVVSKKTGRKVDIIFTPRLTKS